MTPERNASWCYAQDGSECGWYKDSRVSVETWKWIEHIKDARWLKNGTPVGAAFKTTQNMAGTMIHFVPL